MDDHLCYELVCGVPCGGCCFGKGLAEAVVGHVRAHVGVDVEVLAVVEEAEVEA